MTSYFNFPNTNRVTRLSVQTRKLTLERGFQKAVPRILAAALSQFAPRIQTIHVWLEDVNGPRGGVDTRCRIELSLSPRGRVTATSLAANEYVAIANAASRAGALVNGRIKRTRTLRRRVANVSMQ
jgi:hypothetical protein